MRGIENREPYKSGYGGMPLFIQCTQFGLPIGTYCTGKEQSTDSPGGLASEIPIAITQRFVVTFPKIKTFQSWIKYKIFFLKSLITVLHFLLCYFFSIIRCFFQKQDTIMPFVEMNDKTLSLVENNNKIMSLIKITNNSIFVCCCVCLCLFCCCLFFRLLLFDVSKAWLVWDKKVNSTKRHYTPK